MLENCRMMDMNHDSLVDLNEFLEAFRLCQQFNKGHSAADKLQVSKENSSTIVITPEKKEIQQIHINNEPDKVDEYEFSEMKESLNVGGELRKSPSVRSVVSVDSLNRTGKMNGTESPQETFKKDGEDFDRI